MMSNVCPELLQGCEVTCSQPCAYSRSLEPCVASCGDSRAVIFPPPVVLTFPGPTLSTCSQESVVGASHPLLLGAPIPNEESYGAGGSFGAGGLARAGSSFGYGGSFGYGSSSGGPFGFGGSFGAQNSRGSCGYGVGKGSFGSGGAFGYGGSPGMGGSCYSRRSRIGRPGSCLGGSS